MLTAYPAPPIVKILLGQHDDLRNIYYTHNATEKGLPINILFSFPYLHKSNKIDLSRFKTI